MAGDVIVIERELLNSNAFRQLNGTAKTVYLDFRMKMKGTRIKPRNGRKKKWVITNNGEIEYTYSEAEKRGIKRQAFMHAIDSLIEVGLIDITHSGSGGVKGDKSLYAISDRWRKLGTPDFIRERRPRDTRQGRGFKKGNLHWKKNAQKNNPRCEQS